MSSLTPSAGEENSRNKACHTNNSVSHELVTPLTAKKKGKGVAIIEELDPNATSLMNGSPLPATGLVLSGPHLMDWMNPVDFLEPCCFCKRELSACCFYKRELSACCFYKRKSSAHAQ
jgi:hypothetical protein